MQKPVVGHHSHVLFEPRHKPLHAACAGGGRPGAQDRLRMLRRPAQPACRRTCVESTHAPHACILHPAGPERALSEDRRPCRACLPACLFSLTPVLTYLHTHLHTSPAVPLQSLLEMVSVGAASMGELQQRLETELAALEVS